MPSGSKPTSREGTEQGPTLRNGLYNICAILAQAMLICSVASLVGSAFAAPHWIAAAAEHLRKVFQPEAMAAVVTLVGLPGAAFAVLISRLEDRVCGVRMSDLIEDSYHHFFQLYFFVFMVLSISAVLLGEAGVFFWPVFYAFLGVLITFICLCWVCYVFLIRSDLQEQLALNYYRKQFEKGRAAKGVGQQDDSALRQLFQNTAEYARSLLLQGHRNRLQEIAQLWLDVFSKQPSPSWDDGRFLAPNEPILQDCTLCTAAWFSLLPNGLATAQDTEILHNMLEYLDKSVTSEEKRYTYGRQVLLLGLAQFLTESIQESSDQEAKRLCALTYGRQNRFSDQDLACACLMMRTVDWLDGSLEARDDLARGMRLLQDLIDCILLDEPPKLFQVQNGPLSGFLHCAESLACYRRCTNSNEFFLRAADRLNACDGAVGIAAILAKKERRVELLNFLLRQAGVDAAPPVVEPPNASPFPPKSAARSASPSDPPKKDQKTGRFQRKPNLIKLASLKAPSSAEPTPKQHAQVAMTATQFNKREV